MILASGCICGKHLFERENEGTCTWCGHGHAHAVPELAYRRNMEHNGAPAGVLTIAAPAPAPVLRSRFRRAWTAEECVEAAREWERVHGHLPRSYEWQPSRERDSDRPTYGTIRRLFGGWVGFMREIADVPRERVAA